MDKILFNFKLLISVQMLLSGHLKIRISDILTFYCDFFCISYLKLCSEKNKATVFLTNSPKTA